MKYNKELLLIGFLLIVLAILYRFSRYQDSVIKELGKEILLNGMAADQVYDKNVDQYHEKTFAQAEKAKPKRKLT